MEKQKSFEKILQNSSMQKKTSMNTSSYMFEELISVVVHDMRSPLMCIQGNLELIDFELKQTKFYELVAPLVQSSIAASTLLGTLVSDILDSARISKGIFKISSKKMNLRETIHECIETVKMAAKSKKNELLFEFQGTDMIISDKQRIKQVILNFLSNSLKFTKFGKIKITAKDEFDRKLITVEDNGEGMSKEATLSLFEKFSSDRNNRSNSKGIGLGLFICKSIIETIGPKDKIVVHSEVGVGTKLTFEIYMNTLSKGLRESPNLKPIAFNSSRVRSVMDYKREGDESTISKEGRRKSFDIFELNNQGVSDSRRVIEVRKMTRMKKEDEPFPQVEKKLVKTNTVAEEMMEESYGLQDGRNLGENDEIVNMSFEQNSPVVEEIKILIVDDDSMILELLQMYTLQFSVASGYHLVVEIAECLEDGISRAKRENFNIIVSDYHLSDGTGLQLVSAVRECSDIVQKPLFILVTGQEDGQELEELAPHFFEILQKPVSMTYWSFILEKCIEKIKEELTRKNQRLKIIDQSHSRDDFNHELKSQSGDSED